MENNNDTNIWSDDYVAPVQTPAETTPPADITPPIETPVVETPIVETPVIENQPADTTPPVINEIVSAPAVTEKIVEKYPDFADEDSKHLYDAFVKGDKDKIFNYLDEQRRDYNSMSDYDVVKAGLKKEHPDWTDKRLDLEFKNKYDIQAKRELPDVEVDPEGYEKAVAFNDAVTQKEMLLEMQAEDYRIKLNSQKKDIQLPQIQETTNAVTEPSPEELAHQAKEWEDSVAAAMPEVSDIRLTVNGEEVVYKVTDEDRTGLAATMKDFNAMDFLAKERKWINEDGTPNIKNMAEDVYRFRNMDKMFSSVATRAKTEATKTVVAEIKNIDLTKNGVQVESPKKDAGEVVWNY